MALARPKAKELSAEAYANIASSSAQQTGKVKVPKSYDPKFPAFEVPINQKVLAYIPNHTYMTPDGAIAMRMDKFAAHPVKDGRSHATVRCSAGIIDETLHLDGSCPLCDGINEYVWDLYNKEYEAIATSQGYQVGSPEAVEGLKQQRKDLLEKRAVREAEVWYTFPIVVIECEQKDGNMTTTPKKTPEGQLVGHPMWYSVREKTYKEKWEKAFETVETDDGVTPTVPAGLWAILNFTYEVKENSKHDKMGSARALQVGYKTMTPFAEWAKYFDQLTEEWTPQKAMETLVANAVRDMDEMTLAADDILKATKEKIQMYSLPMAGGVAPQAGIGAGTQDANASLANFGATPSGVETPAITGEVPDTGVGANPPQVTQP